MIQLDRTWPELFNQILSMIALPKFINTIAFLIRNDFIVGANNPPGQMIRWVGLTTQCKTSIDIINNGNNSNQNNVTILGTFEGEYEK